MIALDKDPSGGEEMRVYQKKRGKKTFFGALYFFSIWGKIEGIKGKTFIVCI